MTIGPGDASSRCEVLPDILDFGLAELFVGEAAGAESARRGQYYADPSNTFWRDIHEAGMLTAEFVPRYRTWVQAIAGV